MFVRNLVLIVVITSACHLYFHRFKRQGDERKAISMLERAVAEDSSHEEAAALLGQLKG